MAPKFAVLLWLCAPAIVSAQTATQVVHFEVTGINQIAVSGTPAPLVINAATAGSAPAAATSSGTTWAVTTNQSNMKVTASVDEALPAGVTLEVSLAPPAGAVGVGHVPLGTASADVVTGISGANASSLPITYRLSATTTTPTTGPQSRVVTFTIVAGS